MKIEYNNLYTHFIFITQDRYPTITEKNRNRIEKYMTGIINNNDSKLYAIFANPDHVHLQVSRSPNLSESELARIVCESTKRFINQNKLCVGRFSWQDSASAFSVSKSDVDKVLSIFLISPSITRRLPLRKSTKNLLNSIRKQFRQE